MFDLRQAFGWLSQARLIGRGDEPVTSVSTDSRRILPGALFVALRGEAFDAHDFAVQACLDGAGALMLERWVPGTTLPVLLVANARKAYGELARGWRSQFHLPVISVAGSNGKTTTKEMIAAILSANFGERAVLSTRGNLNNDVGVPKTLLALRPRHCAAVVELGTNHPGEIAELAAFTLAGVALVTNAQREHQEFLHGVEASARENGASFEALPPDGLAVFPGDDACAPIWLEQAAGRRVMPFGLAASAGRFPVWADVGARPEQFDLHVPGQTLAVRLGIAGRHNVRNALAAAACAHAIGIPGEAIVRGLQAFKPASGRLQSYVLPGGTRLIDDSYNANPDSVRAAVDVLMDQPSPRTLVLGDMGEVGENGDLFHREVGQYAAERGVDRLFGLGDASLATVASFNENRRESGQQGDHFASAEDLLARLVQEQAAQHTGAPEPSQGTLLIKGSRFMKMERMVVGLGIERNRPAQGRMH